MKANARIRQSDDAVSPVIGVILMVAITVVLAAVVFVLVSNLADSDDKAPEISFLKRESEGTLTVTKVNHAGTVPWADIVVTGCASTPSTPGVVTAGDQITGCSDTVKVRHVPTNTLIYSTVFA